MAAVVVSRGQFEQQRSDLALVCPQCGLVHHVQAKALARPAIACPHCAHNRATSELVAILPRFMVKSFF